MFIEKEEKDKLLKLIGIATVLNMAFDFHSAQIEYNDSDGNQRIEDMTREEMDSFIDSCWEDLQ